MAKGITERDLIERRKSTILNLKSMLRTEKRFLLELEGSLELKDLPSKDWRFKDFEKYANAIIRNCNELYLIDFIIRQVRKI